MNTRVLIAAAAALLAAASASHASAGTITGSYTAYAYGTSGYIPYINDGGSGYLPGSFSEPLTVGSMTTPTDFIQIDPVSGASSVGTLTGTVRIGFTLSDGTAVTSVTANGNAASLSGGVISLTAYYELFYGNQTDCVTFNSTTCTVTGNTTTISDTLAVTFADGEVLDVNLYNWSDWTMMPDISFEEMSGPPAAVEEPASLAILGLGLTVLGLVKRRRSGGSLSGLQASFA